MLKKVQNTTSETWQSRLTNNSEAFYNITPHLLGTIGSSRPMVRLSEILTWPRLGLLTGPELLDIDPVYGIHVISLNDWARIAWSLLSPWYWHPGLDLLSLNYLLPLIEMKKEKLDQ